MTTSSSSLNHDGLMLLEAPFARVPHDELRSYLRTQQRFVERDLTFCSSTLDSLAKSSKLSRSASVAAAKEAAATTKTTEAEVSMEDQANTSNADASLLSDVTFTASETAGNESSLLLGDLGSTSIASAHIPLAAKTGSELDRSLDLMIGRIKGLKRKLAQVHESTGATLTRLDARTAHLDEVHQIQTTASPAFDEWCRTRLDRMLVDWMLRKGFSQSAELLAKNRRIENFVDLSLFSEIARIEASLVGATKPVNDVDESSTNVERTRSCGPSLAWCSENKAALRKIRSSLEFELRLQEFIELTRNRTPESLQEAIAYSRRHLLTYLTSSPLASTRKASSTTEAVEAVAVSGNSAASINAAAAAAKAKAEEKEEREEREQQEAIRKQVARVMGLLACGPGGWAYSDLYAEARWQMLRAKFRDAALQIHSLPPQPLLHIALSAGLSSLKLPACYADEQQRTGSGDTVPPSHLGGRAFGDERSNLLSVAGVTFPPAAGVPVGGLQDAPPSVVLSPPAPHHYHHHHHHHNGSTVRTHNNGGIGGNPVNSSTKNANCPVCDAQGLGVLAKEVPWSHHANSTLVCAISGRIMDENDSPMAMPNGRVYSLTALQEMAANSHDGKTIVCPRTGAEYQMSQLRKVYIS